MKKLILSSILFFLTIMSYAQSQEVMVIEKSDASTVTIDVNDVKRITFQSINIEVITGIIPDDTYIEKNEVYDVFGSVYGDYPSTTTCGIIYEPTLKSQAYYISLKLFQNNL